MNRWSKKCCELNYGSNRENTTICFVSTDKHPYLEEQVQELKVYFKDVFIMIDKYYDDLQLPYLQIKNMKDKYYSNVLAHGDGLDKYTNSWSKSMYHFRDLQTDNIWFIEYDVFIPSVDILLKLNQNKEHLLVKDHIPYTGKKGEWSHWRKFKSQKITDFNELYHSMVCICRVSKELLKLVYDFSQTNKKLFYHEILFNTLANHNNLSVKCCDEFKYVKYLGNSTKTSFNSSDVYINGTEYIYHPVKDLNKMRNIKFIINQDKKI